MPAMRTRLVLLVLVALVASSGCISNMGELKEALGVTEPEPTFLPPVAKATANLTTALTGAPVRFSAEGSRDPQQLPLTYTWRFGADPGAAERSGLEIQHVFTAPGEWRVTLTVANDKGLTDEATLVVQVAQGNRAPVARIQLPDAGPFRMGEAVRFEATATDADDNIATYEWDFGDGGTSHERLTQHAFKQPGLHTVRLRVLDAGGLSAEASRLVAVDGSWTFTGGFQPPSQENSRAHAFPVAEGATQLLVELTFDGALGGDLYVVIEDTRGGEVARSEGGNDMVGANAGSTARTVTLAGDALRAYAPGEWRAVVVKAQGLQAEYTLSVHESF